MKTLNCHISRTRHTRIPVFVLNWDLVTSILYTKNRAISSTGTWRIWPFRVLGKHFLLRVGAPTIGISKGPKQNLMGASIQIHYQFSNFEGSIGPSGKISQGPHWIFRGPGPLPPGPWEPCPYLCRLIQPRPRGEEGKCSYLLPLSHRDSVWCYFSLRPVLASLFLCQCVVIETVRFVLNMKCAMFDFEPGSFKPVMTWFKFFISYRYRAFQSYMKALFKSRDSNAILAWKIDCIEISFRTSSFTYIKEIMAVFLTWYSSTLFPRICM